MTVLAYPVPPGVLGLGHHAAHVVENLAGICPDLELFGPTSANGSVVGGAFLHHPSPAPHGGWQRRYGWLRYATGAYQLGADRAFGEWLASSLARQPFDRGYFFSQIARESLEIARTSGAQTILDSPTGHIRDFRDVLCRESRQWTGWPYFGHPSETMVTRVEAEYALADRIRVSSAWAGRSLAARGVDASKIFVVPQAVDTMRFVPPPTRVRPEGRLRLAFVGSVSLGKGFQYLLRSMQALGASRFSLEIVGATGDTWSRRLFDRLRAGLDVRHAAGDPLAAYQRAELFVFPTLHDGFGLVVAEAMACGLPVLTTDCCGAAEWIVPGESGWIVPAANQATLTAALEHALDNRERLPAFGRAARCAAERLSSHAYQLRDEVRQIWSVQ